MQLKYQYDFTRFERFNDVSIELNENKTLNNPDLITIFLGSDIQGAFSSVKKEIREFDKVLSGEEEHFQCSYNATDIEMDRYKTVIEELFPDDEDYPLQCEVETIELRKLLLVWFEELTKYKYTRGKITKEETETRLNWIEKQKRIGDKLEEDMRSF